MKEKTKEFMKKNFKWLVLFIALIGFLALAEDVFNKEITNTSIKYKLPDTGGSGIDQYYQAAFVLIALGLLVILVRYIQRRVG